MKLMVEKKYDYFTLQCRGPDGNLGKDVGVLIRIDLTSVMEKRDIFCPHKRQTHYCACEEEGRQKRCCVYYY